MPNKRSTGEPGVLSHISRRTGTGISMKMFLTVVLAIFSSLFLAVIYLLKVYHVPIAGNVMPEVLGFCLDGIFFVVLFTWIVDHYTKAHESAKKRELKTTALKFIGIFLMWGSREKMNESGEVKHTYSITEISSIIEHIEASDFIGVSAMFLKEFAVRELPNFRSLYPVVAQIGANHLICWCTIINNLEGICESEGDLALKKPLVEFLKAVQSFENLPIEI